MKMVTTHSAMVEPFQIDPTLSRTQVSRSVRQHQFEINLLKRSLG